MMFSGIDSACVPRAQVSVSLGGRSGSASHSSTPAVIACAQRSFGIAGSSPGGTTYGHQRLRPRELIGGRLLLARQGIDRDAVGEAGRLDRVKIGGARVGPEQDIGAVGHAALLEKSSRQVYCSYLSPGTKVLRAILQADVQPGRPPL